MNFIFVFIIILIYFSYPIIFHIKKANFWFEVYDSSCITTISTEYISSCAIFLFLWINIWIIFADIRERKIPNILLMGLSVLLIIWLILFPIGNNEVLISQSILSFVLILWGIFFYTENGFLGSGDIKYGAILLLFLGWHSLPLYIGNIGALTLVTLLFWWSMILGQITALRQYLWENEKKIFFQKIQKKEFLKDITVFIWDWVIIGFFISLIFKDISLQVFQFVTTGGDFYFLLSLIIFILRPAIRYLLTKWQYRIYPLIGILLYFWFSIQSTGWESLMLELVSFIRNIWQYILIFTLASTITSKTFSVYDTLMERIGLKSMIHTIPYSIIIFGAFCLTYFWDINLMGIIKGL